MENLVMSNTVDTCYRGKRVLVTGHTGFKGAWLLTWLQQLGSELRGYALAPEDAEGLFTVIGDRLPFVHQEADIRDAETLEKAVLDFQPDFIFHLAAQALVRRSYRIPADTFAINAVGTANLLEAVTRLEKKCTVVVVTTDKVYENRETGHLYAEDDTLGGYDPYSASKAATEIVVSSFRNSFFNPASYAQHQKALVSARAGNVIGGGDWSADRLVPDLVRALQRQEPILVRNPASVRPWQHVLEPLSGYLLLGMQADREPARFAGAYNFGPLPDDHLSVQQLVETAIRCWGSGKWVNGYDPSQPHEAGLLHLSVKKAQEQLHWQPRLNSRQAVEWTLDWYRQPRERLYEFTVNQIEQYRLL